MKKCTRCAVLREDSEFRKQPQNRDGMQSWCKYCQNASKEEWRKKNTEKVNQHSRDFYVRDPRRARGRMLQKFFRHQGVTCQQAADIYDRMIQDQNGSCAICKRLSASKSLNVDHCHKTGKIRGLLCHSCNLTLGRMNESIEHLHNAIAYLKKHQ